MLCLHPQWLNQIGIIMKFSTFTKFKKEVANILKSRHGMNIKDTDKVQLNDSFEQGWTPEEHVELVAIGK